MRADLTAGDATTPSVIVHAHGLPRWLELALWALASQSHRAFEIVVADDGSGPMARDVIERFERASGRAVVHVRAEGDVAGTAEILDRAILASRGDYLIFLDARCVARRDLVATHVRLARAGAYVAGSAISMGAAVADRVSVDDVVTGRAFDRAWLAPHRWRERRAAARLSRGARWGAARDLTSRAPARFTAANASTWRGLLVAANGFDLDMRLGGEDRALGLRLAHMGVRGVVARARAVALRLDADVGARAAGEVLRDTRAVFTRIRTGREVRAPRGLAEVRASINAAGAPAAPSYQSSARP